MTADAVLAWIDDDVAHLRLNQPDRLNPLGPREWDAVRDLVGQAERTPGVRAIVLDSEGRYFCAGNDLRVIAALEGPEAAHDYFVTTQLAALRALAASPLPVICAVHAPTAGGGIELSMVSDLVLAAESATFALPESRVGLFATTVLAATPFALSRSALQRLAFAGEPVTADDARRLGIVHEVVPDAEFPGAIVRALDAVRRSAPASVAATKAAINAQLLESGFDRMRSALEHLGDTLLFSDDGREGLAAFRERRAPQWRLVTPAELPAYGTPRPGAPRSGAPRSGAPHADGALPALGATFRFSKTVSESDVYLLAGISGDLSPNHVDAEYMRTTEYGERIAHGILPLALASTTSTQVQAAVGRPCVSYGYDRVRFLAPVFLGDTLTVTYRISEVDVASQRSWAAIEVTDQRGRLCLVAVHILKFQ